MAVEKKKIGIIVGSARQESINKKLALAIEKSAIKSFEILWIQISDLPIFNQDLEKDLPETVKRFKNEVASCEGLIFVTPEHNRAVPALMKNAIDWGSRPVGQSCWAKKRAALAGTSPGALGTSFAQNNLRQSLVTLNVFAMPAPEMYLTFKPELIDATGKVTVEKTAEFIDKFVEAFAAFLKS